MPLNSVNTNLGAMVALQSLNRTNDELQSVQKRISTGYRVSDAKDDGAAFAVAQRVRGDMAGLTSANDQLGGVKGLIDTTIGSMKQVSDVMSDVKTVLEKLADANTDTTARAQYTAQFKSDVDKVNTFLQDANYNGTRLLSSTATNPLTGAAYTGGTVAVTRNEAGQTYSVNASAATADNMTFASDIVTSVSATSITAADAQEMLQTAAGTALTGTTTGSTKSFATVEKAINDAMNQLGNDSKFVDSQVSFNKDRLDAMDSGLGALVDADMAKESARLQALQIKQQLGTQALGIANQSPQSLLSLFR